MVVIRMSFLCFVSCLRRWDTLCLTAMVGFTGRCELFDGDECRLPLITESGYMKTAFLD